MGRRLQVDQRNPIVLPATKFGRGSEYTLMEKGVQAHKLRLTASAALTVTDKTGGATRNKGSLWAPLVLKITHGGDIQVWRGRQLAYLTEMFAPSQRSALTRVPATASLANTTYNLIEHVALYFAFPFLAKRRETAFMERNPSADTKVEISTNSASPVEDIISGAANAALGDILVDVVEDFDAVEEKKPLYQPYVKQLQIDVAAAVNEKSQAIQLAADETLLGMLIEEEAGTVGEVSDILTSFRLRDGQYVLFGMHGMVDKSGYQRSLETEWGGKVYDPAYTPIWFPYDAKLSNAYKPRSLEFIYTAKPTVTAGADANSSRLNIALIIGKRDTVQLEKGRTIVAPAVPFKE